MLSPTTQSIIKQRIEDNRVLFSTVFSPTDGTKVACSSSVGSIAVFDWRASIDSMKTHPGRIISEHSQIYQAHDSYIYDMVNVSDDILATAGDKDVRIWSWGNLGAVKAVLKPPPLDSGDDPFLMDPEINGLCVLGGTLFGACGDNKVHGWDIVTGQPTVSLTGHTNYCHCVTAWGENNLASGSEDGTVRLWDTRTKNVVDVLSNDEKWVASVDIDQGQNWLVCGGGSGVASLWSIQNRRVGTSIPMPSNSPITSCMIDGGDIIMAGLCSKILIANFRGNLLNSIDSSSDVLYNVNVCDGTLVAAGSSDYVDVFATKTHLTVKLPFPKPPREI